MGVLAEIQTRHSRIQVRRITNWANMLANGEGSSLNMYILQQNDPFQFHSTRHFIPTLTPSDRLNISGHIILQLHVWQQNRDWSAFRNVGTPSTCVTAKPKKPKLLNKPTETLVPFTFYVNKYPHFHIQH